MGGVHGTRAILLRHICGPVQHLDDRIAGLIEYGIALRLRPPSGCDRNLSYAGNWVMTE
jgi:hypothetical protein